MRKSAILIAVLMILMAAMPVSAATPPSPLSSSGMIVPFWSNVTYAAAGISKSGRSVQCTGSISAPSSTISGTLYLQKYVNGRWSTVTSWSVSGTGSVNISKTYTGASGTTYRTYLSATVTKGTVKDSIQEYSSSITV